MLTNVTNARRASIAQILTASVIINVSTFGSMFEQSLAPAGIVNTSAFGSPTLVADQVLAPARIANASTFGAPTIIPDKNLAPAAVANVSTFGAQVLVPDRFLVPTRLANVSTFGAPSIVGQGAPQTLTQTRIASATTFGAAVLHWDQVLAPARVANASTFGSSVIISDQHLALVRVANTSSFGAPRLDQRLTPTRITNTSTFGAPRLDQTLAPTRIANTSTFGAPSIANAAVPITVTNLGATSTNATTTSLTLSVGVPAGSLIVVAATSQSQNSFTVTDTAGNTYVQAVSAKAGGVLMAEIYYCKNCLALSAGNTIVTHLGIANRQHISALYAANAHLTAPLDKTASAHGSSTAPSSGATAALAVTGELAVGLIAANSTTTFTQAAGWAAPFTAEASNVNYQLYGGNKIVSGTGAQTYSPTQTANQVWEACAATFKPA